MRQLAAFLNLVVAASLRGCWEEEIWLFAYQAELPEADGRSSAEKLWEAYVQS